MKLWGKKASFLGWFSPETDHNEDATNIINLKERTCLREQIHFDRNLMNLLVKLVVLDLGEMNEIFKCKVLLESIQKQLSQ